MKIRIIAKLASTASIFIFAGSPAWADLDSEVLHLQQRWSEVNYELEGKTRVTAFRVLMDDAAIVTAQYPDAAQVWIWSGIIKFTYAGAKGGIGALKIAKASRADLEQALKIEPESMNGSAYTNLGALYFNVPRWPFGFGDDKKAEELLLKGISIDPVGIDSNYFYGDYLRSEKRYPEAEIYLLKAQSAPQRPDLPLADAGRQQEIEQALLAVRKKLGK